MTSSRRRGIPVSSNLMYWIKLVGGVLLLLLGLVWVLQGLDVLGGSSMSGQSQWLLIGALVALVGMWLLFSSLRGRAPR